jgi:PAS domain S-box-containing protein
MEGTTAAAGANGLEAYAMLEALYAGAPVGVGFWDTDCRFRRVNPRLAQINGLPPEAHLGHRPSELLGELGAAAEDVFRRVIATGSPVVEMSFSGETPADPGRTRHWLATFFPVADAAGATGVGGVVTEVTDRHEAAEREHAALRVAETARARAEALARASTALASSMRSERVLSELVRAVVPTLADICAVHLAQPAGPPELIAAAHTDPGRDALARRLGLSQVNQPEALPGPRTVIETGVAEIYPDLSDAQLRGAAGRGDEVSELLAELGVRSALVLPLKARGTVLGALTLIMGPSGRRYERDLVDLAESLALLAGLALDNARLFAEQAQVASAFQRTLLPAELPEVPGATLAARYRAAGRSNQVGGDFYDVFPAGEGEWAIAIGDVVGKGAEAAAITALVRATLRAAVLRGDGPEASLRLVDEALRRRDSVQFCSALHGRMHPAPGGGLDVRLLAAGHPPPLLLRAEGALESVDVAGTLLGITPDPVFGQASFHLGAGDTLLLYTDGATELRGGDRWRGEAALRETLLTAAGVPVAQLVERVEHEALVLSGGELRDDLALLAICATPPPGE